MGFIRIDPWAFNTPYNIENPGQEPYSFSHCMKFIKKFLLISEENPMRNIKQWFVKFQEKNLTEGQSRDLLLLKPDTVYGTKFRVCSFPSIPGARGASPVFYRKYDSCKN
jgi:hypothetical protein